MKIHISNGNMKIGKIPNISLTPGACCASDAPCKKDCYAMKAYRQFKGTRDAWFENTKLAQEEPCEYFRQIKEFLWKKKPEFFRWHVAGDILNEDYFDDMVALAYLFPGTKFLAFTKRMDILTARNWIIPENFSVVQSMWPGWGAPVDGYPVAWMQDGMETRVPGTAFVCPGKCWSCNQHCWSMGGGDHVMFQKH